MSRITSTRSIALALWTAIDEEDEAEEDKAAPGDKEYSASQMTDSGEDDDTEVCVDPMWSVVTVLHSNLICCSVLPVID